MFPMLPAAETNQDDFATGKPGQWHKRAWADLEIIANRTRSTADEENRIEVDLIPDIWARHILFASALYDEKHPLHSKALAAFRGFLALLALRARKNIVLRATELRLESGDTLRFRMAARNAASAGHGVRQLYAETGWNEVHLFRGDGNSVLGVTSPLTLFCPAEGPAMGGLKNLPSAWFNGARFCDPSVNGALSSQDAAPLADWLTELRSDLARQATAQNLRWRYGHERLLEILREFAEALNPNVEGPNVERTIARAESDLRLGGSAYRYLGMALKPDHVNLQQSDLLLDSKVAATRVLLPFRVKDKEVAIEPYIDPGKLTVVTGTSLLDIDTAVWGNNPRMLATRPLPEDAEWIDAKSLFLDRLYLLKGTQQKSGMNHAKGQDDVAVQLSYYPVLPFTQRLTELVSADQIAQYVRFSVENQGAGDAVVVKLRLPLRGGKTLQFSKTYNAEHQSQLDQIPVLEVWPPFRKPGWKHYNTFWWTNSAAAFSAEPFPLAKGEELKERSESLAGDQVRVTELSQAPGGFFLRVPHPQRGQAAMQEAGIILNRYIDLSEISPTGTWSAGVDFGTSSTHVVLRSGKEGTERRLRLEKSGPLRIVFGKDADRPRPLYRYFLPFNPAEPELAETSPFLSFLRMRHPENLQFDPIADSHVLFYSPSHNSQELSAGRLATNLKWEGESKTRSRPYIQQICLQAAAEAVFGGVESLNWSYSLPAAFSIKKQDETAQEWEKICNYIEEQTGLRSTQRASQMMESFATARYFKEREEASTQVGAVFLDIGGATTDISVWQQNAERCGVSVRFAGRAMFLAPLFEMRGRMIDEFERVLGSKLSREAVIRLKGDQHQNEFFAHCEAMLRDTGLSLPQKLHDQDTLEEIALPLRFAIAGLFYYVGMILRHLESSGDFTPDLAGVYTGGNGSQLLHWANGGSYRPTGVLSMVLTDSLFAGAGWKEKAPQNVEIKLSAKPKQEAATGLVVSSSLPPKPKHWLDVIPGEPMTLADGQAKTETDRLSREDLHTASLNDLPQLTHFYDNFVRCAEEVGYSRITLNKTELIGRAKNGVLQFLADQQQRDVRDVDPTPPFIKALQLLVIGISREAVKTSSAIAGR